MWARSDEGSGEVDRIQVVAIHRSAQSDVCKFNFKEVISTKDVTFNRLTLKDEGSASSRTRQDAPRQFL